MRIPLKEVSLVFLISILFFLQFASAEILFSQPESLYNKGDDFDLTIKVNSPLKDASGFLTANLVCEGDTIELYKSPISVKKDSQEEIKISTSLGRFLVGATEGRCHVSAEFGDDKADSPRFELTNNVDVSLNIEGVVFDPGSNVKAYGEAKKSNDVNLEGFVEISVSSLDFNLVSSIVEGKFDFNFTVPENAPSGNYNIEAHAYERDGSGEILNEGKIGSMIKVSALMKEIEVALAEKSIAPKNDLVYTIMIYDQAKEEVDTDASLIFYNPNGEVLFKDLVKTGQSNTFSVEPNYSAGYWKIEASINELRTERTFFIEENKELSYSLEDTTLTVTNLGNVPYSGPVKINIGDVTELKDIEDLKMGGVKQYRLVAPDGKYTIEVGDGSGQANLGQTFLTGRVVSVEDIGSFLGTNLTVIIAIIVILIIAITGLYFYRRISKGKSVVQPKPLNAGLVKKDQPAETTKLAASMDHGQKQESAVLSLKIKNPEVLENPNVSKTLDSALWKAKESNAKIYVNGDFRLAVFSPILTKQKDNSLPAIRTAQAIERILSDHNKRFNPKIQFGVGVNIGELIVEIKEGKFKFISTDNTIAATKNISQNSTGEVLLSEKLHRITAGKIKTEKLAQFNLWKVLRVVDRSDQKAFLNNMGAK